MDILCFCRALFEQLQGWGLRVRYAQYFPDPRQFTVNPRPDYAGFFWQRRPELPWETIRSLLGKRKLSWINLHQAPDFEMSETEIPERDRKRYRMRFSTWSEDGTDYAEALHQAGIYFAPRLYEGIGMSFLEAMAMGKAVVAPDNPTMNEYVRHNVNGFLYNPEEPCPINFKRFREMGKAARETIERGHRRWQESREELGAWILGESSRTVV
jgi:glycosyltransferase involved in cell wall biosynthesis